MQAADVHLLLPHLLPIQSRHEDLGKKQNQLELNRRWWEYQLLNARKRLSGRAMVSIKGCLGIELTEVNWHISPSVLISVSPSCMYVLTSVLK